MHSQHTTRQLRQPFGTHQQLQASPWRAPKHQRQQQQQSRLVVQAKPGDVLLVAEGISKTYDGEKQLFGNLTFTVVAGTKLAIVGPNGAGKSTLLKILGKKAQHDSGLISRKEGALVGYLPQTDIAQLEQQQQQQQPSLSSKGNAGSNGDMTVLQAVLESDSQVAKVVQTYQSALSAASGAITPQLEAAIEAMNTHNAWQLDSEARQKLGAVGLHDPDAKVFSLSGGQRRRLSLAAALLGNPDLLILDEPTNHMDAAMISWMEEEIKASPDMAVVMVSHDRAFMESCCTQLLELDHGGFTAMHPFGGNGSYDAFKEARAARRAAQASAAADARTVLRREAEWMARQPKARSTKAKARVDAFSELQEKARDTPPPDVKPDFGRVAMLRLGNKAVELVNVSVSTPDGSQQLLKDFSYEFLPGSRIGIAGPNGAGKSTLLDVVAGLRQPQSGRVDVGETAVIGYFQQHPPPVPDNLRLIDYIRDVAEKRKARKGDSGLTGPVDIPEVLLEKLGFPRKIQFQKVESLSGGERRRLHLAAVLASTPNVLILDEPTNDLDLSTVEVLEEMLSSYRGLLLVVSHDRSFMEGSTTDLLVLPGDGTVQRYMGTYSNYLRDQQKRQAVQEQQRRVQQDKGASNGAASSSGSSNGNGSKASSSSTVSKPAAAVAPSNGSSSSSSSKAAKSSSKRTLGLFERQEYEKLTKDMSDLEVKLKKGSDKLTLLTDKGAAWADIEALSLEMAELQAQYDQKEERWFELAEIAGDL